MENLTNKFYRGLQKLIEKFIEDIEKEEELETKVNDRDLKALVLSKSKNYSVKIYKLNNKEFLFVSGNNIIEKFETMSPINFIGYYTDENIPVYLVVVKDGETKIYEYDGKLNSYSKLKDLKHSKFICMNYKSSYWLLEEVSKILDGKHNELRFLTDKNVKEIKLNLKKLKVNNYELFNGSIYCSTSDSKNKFEIKSKYFLILPNYEKVKNNILIISEVKRESDFMKSNYLLITNIYKTKYTEEKVHQMIKKEEKPYSKLKVEPMLSYYKDNEGNFNVSLAVILNHNKEYFILNIPSCHWKIPIFEKPKRTYEKKLEEGFKLRDVIIKMQKKENNQ